ncbi:MAG TPA: hypothetical protein VK138_16895 [Acidiferrobacterales bacterium]|nr:hypothetical protein [Acidiferrobacterales bacterium]
MTEQELEIFRLKTQIQALQVLVAMLYSGLANSSPSAAQALREKLSSLRQEHSKIVLKDIPAEYSDMLSAEYQESLDDLLSFIENRIKK